MSATENAATQARNLAGSMMEVQADLAGPVRLGAEAVMPRLGRAIAEAAGAEPDNPLWDTAWRLWEALDAGELENQGHALGLADALHIVVEQATS